MKNATINQLQNIRMHCAAPGWNGYNAKAISPSSWANAKRLAETVFANLPNPHVSVDGLTGSISFQWGDVRQRAVIMIVGSDSDAPLLCLKGVSGMFTQKMVRADSPELVREVEACQ